MNVYDLYCRCKKDTTIFLIGDEPNEEPKTIFKGHFEYCPVMYFGCEIKGLSADAEALYITI